jgi:hypothetical protein
MLRYHIDNGISLSESVYRIGSIAYKDVINEARELYLEGKLDLNESDRFIVEKLKTGQTGIYQGKEVDLDSPKRGGNKKFIVYTDSGRKDKDGKIVAKKIEWGDPKLSVKNFDDKARKSFLARHQCDKKTDTKTAGWWACNVHRFYKQLGLSSDKPW